MKKIQPKQPFLIYWGFGGLLFISLLSLSYHSRVYELFPAYGFIGYSLTIFTVMMALSKAWLPWHYILVSISLILFGTVASLDIVLSKQEMMNMLAKMELQVLGNVLESQKSLDDYVDVLLILLNVFTSAIAGNALFYGLNRRNFISQEHNPD